MKTNVIAAGPVQQMFLHSLAPVMRLIGLSLGPHGRSILSDIGGRCGPAVSGVAIARQAAAEHGALSLAPRLLKETLIACDREHGDGSARLALIAGASLKAGVTALTGEGAREGLGESFMEIRSTASRLLALDAEDDIPAREICSAAGLEDELAEILADLFGKIGPQGVLEVRSSAWPGVESEIASGFLFDATPVFARKGGAEALVLDDVHTLAANEVISDFGRLMPVIDGFAARRKNLLIVALDVSGTARAALERNRNSATMSVVAVKPADVGPRGESIIGDLAAMTGAVLVDANQGASLQELKPDGLGRARRLRLAGRRVMLSNPQGDTAAVALRRSQIDGQIDASRYLALDREHAERRRARLDGRWAEIRIGGRSTFETEVRLAAARSAAACMRSAALSGVVCGGGKALTRIADTLESESRTAASATAARIAARGLRSIERQLRLNAGQDPFSISAPEFQERRGGKILIPDPLRLTQAIVDQALSLAFMLLSVGAVVHR